MRLTWPIAHQHTEKSEQNQHVLSYNPIDLIPSPTEELLTGSRGREQQVERSAVAGSRPTGNRWAGYTDNDDGYVGRQRCFARGCEVPVNERVTYRHDLPLIDEGGKPFAVQAHCVDPEVDEDRHASRGGNDDGVWLELGDDAVDGGAHC